MRLAYDRSLEVSRAYCSGYKWLVKNVQLQAGQDADEMPDLDALDNVTLIQKLERAQVGPISRHPKCIQTPDFYSLAALVLLIASILTPLLLRDLLATRCSWSLGVQAEGTASRSRWNVNVQEQCSRPSSAGRGHHKSLADCPGALVVISVQTEGTASRALQH